MTRHERFPKLSRAHYRHILRPPTGMVRCVIDTDTRNEIDDQYALAWAMLSRDKLDIEAIYAAPYSFLARAEQLRQAAEIQRRGAASPEERSLLAIHAGQLKRLAAAGIDPHDDARLDPQGSLLVTPGRGMELSYQEILAVCDKLGVDFSGRVFRGSDRYLGSLDKPVESPAVEHLIATAATASADDPLHVVASSARA